MKVTKDTIIGDILRKYPKAGDIMAKFGMLCIYCPVASAESLGAGAKAHGVRDEDIDALIKEINEFIQKAES